ncbi:MAG TPA: serine hydrolase [Gemmatales bacterium]|nr:serine hydrolase [Gemmatales bacterium]
MFACLFLALLAGVTFAQPAKDEPPAVTWDTLKDRMKWESEHGFTGVVLVARDGQILLHEAYGMANRDKQIPMKHDTILAIGSTPIDFTKAGILLLAQQGKLNLSDPISKFFDQVPDDKKAMTLEQLMTGRSGLPDFHDIPSDKDKDHSWIDRDEAVRRILGSELLFAPGKGRRHSHSAFGLLAAIIEKVSGQSYQDFTREHLYQPAGMTDTGFFGDKIAPERMALGYGPRKDGEINAPPYWGKTSWLVMGSGGQTSTALDMWRWVQAVHGGKLLNEDSRRVYGGKGDILVGGDLYGFYIMYAGDHRNCMIIMSNAVRPRFNKSVEQLGNSLAGLVAGRGPGKFTLGVELDLNDASQVKVATVVPGGSADRSGLRAGDVLKSINGKPIGDDLREMLGTVLQAGKAFEFGIEREGKPLTVTIKPEAR